MSPEVRLPERNGMPLRVRIFLTVARWTTELASHGRFEHHGTAGTPLHEAPSASHRHGHRRRDRPAPPRRHEGGRRRLSPRRPLPTRRAAQPGTGLRRGGPRGRPPLGANLRTGPRPSVVGAADARLEGRLDAERLVGVCDAHGLAADLEEVAVAAMLVEQAGRGDVLIDARKRLWRNVYKDDLLDYLGTEFTCLADPQPEINLGSSGIDVDWDSPFAERTARTLECALRLLIEHPSQGGGVLLIFCARPSADDPIDGSLLAELYAASGEAISLRNWVLETCGRDASEESVHLLLRVSHEENDPEVRAHAIESLGRLAWNRPTIRRLVLGLLDEPASDTDVRRATVMAAAETGESGAFARIDDIARRRPEEVRLLVEAMLARCPAEPEGVTRWGRAVSVFVRRLPEDKEARRSLSLHTQGLAGDLFDRVRKGREPNPAAWASAIRTLIEETRPLIHATDDLERLAEAERLLRAVGLDAR